jgi:hypothetical protein
MIVLNAFVLWHSRNGIPAGLPDFTIFYTAGKIVHQGQGNRLYDNELQETIQRSFSSVRGANGSSLPYNHPPFEALVFAPFARVSYLTAYFCWLGINILLVLGIPLVLRPHLAVLGKEPIFLWLLASFAFYPNFIALMQGQDSIFVLFCYCMAFAALRSQAEFRAGGWLALALCKFHLVLSFVLPFLLLKRKCLVAGFLAVAILLGLVGLVAAGWRGWQAYPGYVLSSENNNNYLWNRALGNTANLRGLIWSVLSANHPWLRGGMLTLLSGLIFAAMVSAWRSSLTAADSQMAFCMGLIATVLLSYHLYVHDLSLIFLAGILALERAGSILTKRVWTRRFTYGCLILLSCNSIYLLFVLRYKHLEFFAIILLVLFVLLWIEFPQSGLAITRDPALAGTRTLLPNDRLP